MKFDKILLSLALSALAAVSAAAQSDESMGFSRIVRDPASAAMGFTGKASDAAPAWASFSNAAMLPLGSVSGAAGLSWQSWAPQTLRSSNISAGLSYRFGIVGLTLGFASQQEEKYEMIDEVGMPTGFFTPSDMVFGGGIGVLLAPGFSLGANARFLSSTVTADDKYTAFGVDFLAAYRLGGMTLTAGVTNLGGSVDDSRSQSFHIPGSVTFAGEYRTVLAEEHGLRADVDADWFLASRAITLGAGAEYDFQKCVFVRAGYHYGSEEAVLPSFVTLGLGGQFKGIRLDLAFLTGNDALGNTLTLGLGYSF